MKNVTLSGVILKIVMLLLITIVAMSITLSFTGGFVFVGWAGFFGAIILGVAQYKALSISTKSDDGLTVMLAAIIFSILTGVFAINAIVVGTYFISMYAEVDALMIGQAASIAFFTVFAVTIGLVVFMPSIVNSIQSGVNPKAISVGSKIVKAFAGFFIGISVLSMLGYILALLGMPGLYSAIIELFYGVSLFSIFISFIGVLMSAFYMFTAIFMIGNSIGNEAKIREWSLAAYFVHAAIQVFVEVFKLALKILARSRRD